MSRSLREPRGQATIEWLGVTVVVVALVLAIGTAGIAGKIVGAVGDAICQVTGGDCASADSPPAAIAGPQDRAAGSGGTGPQSYGAGPGPQGYKAAPDPNADSDGDGLPDRAEKGAGTKPDKSDSDGDGLTDGEELAVGTNPNDKDSDGAFGVLGDGLTDAQEIKLGTDPTKYDSDGDFFCDGCEVKKGDNPLKDERNPLQKLRDHLLDHPFDFILPGGAVKSGGKGVVDAAIKKVAPKLKGLKKGMSLADKAKIRRERIAALKRALRDERGSIEFPSKKAKARAERKAEKDARDKRRKEEAEKKREEEGDAGTKKDESTPDKSGHVPAPKTLEKFPDAKEAPPKTAVQGGGHLRRRWKDKKGRIYEWDYKKGTVEKYDKTGKTHMGEFDPNTGKQVGPPVPGREVEP